MNTVFTTPLYALVALVAVPPLVAALVRERRGGRVRANLGLARPRLRSHAPLVLATLVVALLATAAAQPARRQVDLVRGRSDAGVTMVIDISRSMLASAQPGAPTRFQRAISAAQELSGALPGIPVGVSSFTDRVEPHLLPTADRAAESQVLRRSIAILQPLPSRTEAPVSTDLGALSELPLLDLYPPEMKRHLAILFSDGESTPFDPFLTALILKHYDFGLIIVRLWSPAERIFAGRRPVTDYRPDPSTTPPLKRLARLTTAKRLFDERQLGAATAAARRFLGDGPQVTVAKARRLKPVGRYLVLAAALPLGLLIASRNLG